MRFRKVQKVQPDPCFNKSAASKKCNLAPEPFHKGVELIESPPDHRARRSVNLLMMQ